MNTLPKGSHPIVMYIESLSKYVDNVDRTVGFNTYLNTIVLKKLVQKKLKKKKNIIIIMIQNK